MPGAILDCEGGDNFRLLHPALTLPPHRKKKLAINFVRAEKREKTPEDFTFFVSANPFSTIEIRRKRAFFKRQTVGIFRKRIFSLKKFRLCSRDESIKLSGKWR